ncbi:hypothetical protein [Cerasicoccus arenae]|uniref:DUF4138 domain-containing protein n=1 Tax=Cerasicoccus arenae TaxID=424488 RepID=A0A8J3DIM4_9BACT|nr:hypothetical protein [Cerasicoccus arenae]MBK1858607.1 hypothetical protein [Cerasicoccus arenae]GHC05036.1 hypothetical protein GCM10007047_22450 [Cerasicoccus arenae]
MCNFILKYWSLYSVLLSGFIFPSLACAADAVANVETTFSCVSWGKPIKDTLYVRSDGEMIPLRVHSMRRSSEVDYHGSNPIVFFRKGKDGQEQDAYQPVAQVQLDGSIKKPLFFFAGEGGNYKIVTLEDSFDKYPTGSYRFYNFTERDLIAKMGDEILQLPPKKTAYLPQPFTGTIEYPIAFVVREPGGIRPLYTNMWTHVGRFRYLIFVSDSDSRDTGSMKFRILSDYAK